MVGTTSSLESKLDQTCIQSCKPIFTTSHTSKHITVWKVSNFGIFSVPYFSVFGLNTDQKKLLSLDTYHAVYHTYCFTWYTRFKHVIVSIPTISVLTASLINYMDLLINKINRVTLSSIWNKSKRQKQLATTQRRSGIFTVNLEHISNLVLVFLLLNYNM